MNFKHAGKMGDVIFSLPAISTLGGGSLYLLENPEVEFFTRNIEILLPLLHKQDCITEVILGTSPKEPYTDLSIIFKDYESIRGNLVDNCLEKLSLPPFSVHQQFLKCGKKELSGIKVVVCVTPRYRTDVQWSSVLEPHLASAIYLGTVSEYHRFKRDFSIDLPFYPTADLLEAAEIINGVELFIGNQGALHSIAEGLKKNIMLAIHNSDCHFDRPGVKHLTNTWLCKPYSSILQTI